VTRHQPRLRLSVSLCPGLLALAGCLASVGCQHLRANQYAYAPPLAPPVYPQPQAGSGPVVFPAPAGMPAAVPVAGQISPPFGPVPQAVGPVPQPVGMVAPQSFVVPDGQPCPPCHEGGGVVDSQDGQSPPCP